MSKPVRLTISMQHLALRSTSRGRNGRTRTATFTLIDAILLNYYYNMHTLRLGLHHPSRALLSLPLRSFAKASRSIGPND